MLYVKLPLSRYILDSQLLYVPELIHDDIINMDNKVDINNIEEECEFGYQMELKNIRTAVLSKNLNPRYFIKFNQFNTPFNYSFDKYNQLHDNVFTSYYTSCFVVIEIPESVCTEKEWDDFIVFNENYDNVYYNLYNKISDFIVSNCVTEYQMKKLQDTNKTKKIIKILSNNISG